MSATQIDSGQGIKHLPTWQADHNYEDMKSCVYLLLSSTVFVAYVICRPIVPYSQNARNFWQQQDARSQGLSYSSRPSSTGTRVAGTRTEQLRNQFERPPGSAPPSVAPRPIETGRGPVRAYGRTIRPHADTTASGPISLTAQGGVSAMPMQFRGAPTPLQEQQAPRLSVRERAAMLERAPEPFVPPPFQRGKELANVSVADRQEKVLEQLAQRQQMEGPIYQDVAPILPKPQDTEQYLPSTQGGYSSYAKGAALGLGAAGLVGAGLGLAHYTGLLPEIPDDLIESMGCRWDSLTGGWECPEAALTAVNRISGAISSARDTGSKFLSSVYSYLPAMPSYETIAAPFRGSWLPSMDAEGPHPLDVFTSKVSEYGSALPSYESITSPISEGWQHGMKAYGTPLYEGLGDWGSTALDYGRGLASGAGNLASRFAEYVPSVGYVDPRTLPSDAMVYYGSSIDAPTFADLGQYAMPLAKAAGAFSLGYGARSILGGQDQEAEEQETEEVESESESDGDEYEYEYEEGEGEGEGSD